MVSVMDDGHHRHLIHTNQLTQRLRHIGSNTGRRIARFGIHAQNIAPLQHFIDGLDQVQVHGILAGTDTTDQLHQRRTAVITVHAHHVIHPVRKGYLRAQHKVHKIHVVAQHHIGRLQPFHIDFFYLVFFADQGNFAQNPNQPGKKQGLTNGIVGGIVSFWVFIIGLHLLSPLNRN